MDGSRETFGSNFRRFFVRGLGIILPTVLTIWILIAAYGFVQNRIAAPINAGVQRLVVWVTPLPRVDQSTILDVQRSVSDPRDERYRAYRAAMEAGRAETWLEREARRDQLQRWWANWVFMDLIGLVIAIVLIYVIGVVLGSYIGRRLYHRGEMLINRVPLISRVYPAVKQVTDFFFGDSSEQLKFSRVVAVEYPRKGIWSVGLVTGETMQMIQDRVGGECLTVFVPSSPTPFTGYVITIPKTDTIELPITVEDAIKFAVSGGVLIPPNQRIAPAAGTAVSMRVPAASQA